jgi:hypothetical protein
MSKQEINYSNPKEIAKYIIHQTPIGCLDLALKNLKVLLKETTLNSPEILKEIKAYKENHLTPISIKDVKSKVIISALNKDSDEFYYDQRQKIRFKLGLKCEVINIQEFESKSEIRKKIEQKIIEYVNKYYKKENTYYNVYFDSIVDKIFVLISGQYINNASFCCGEWLSSWELDLNDKKVTGEIKINTIYFEDGNVQFNFHKNYETKNNGKDDESIAKDLIDFIEQNENEIQKNIETKNENIWEEYIKPLRKRISFIGNEMNWSLDQIQFSQNQKK